MIPYLFVLFFLLSRFQFFLSVVCPLSFPASFYPGTASEFWSACVCHIILQLGIAMNTVLYYHILQFNS